jgi:hypothetical protein
VADARLEGVGAGKVCVVALGFCKGRFSSRAETLEWLCGLF